MDPSNVQAHTINSLIRRFFLRSSVCYALVGGIAILVNLKEGRVRRIILSITLLGLLSSLFFIPSSDQTLAVSQYLRIQGNKFIDKNRKQVTLRGASLWALEFGCRPNSHYRINDFQAMRSWGMNAVRLVLNATNWLSRVDGCSAREYQAEVQTAVTDAEKQGLYVMLVLQWEGPHSGQNEPMAYPRDRAFWRQVASAYANDSHVGFVPVTEPHDVSWDQWYNGWNGGPGMKELVQIITTVAPENIIFVNGLGSANDVTFLTNQYAIIGPTIAYEVHIYDTWTNGLTEDLMQRYCIIAGEYGIQSATNLVAQTMNYFEVHKTGYFAWTWTTSADHRVQYLLDDWSGTPRNNLVGKPTHDFMALHKGA